MTQDERLEKARSYNQKMKAQRQAIQETIPLFIKDDMVAANNDAGAGRKVAAKLSKVLPLLDVREYKVGMSTAPGDLVYDAAKNFVYAYSGKAEMVHTNPTFGPGAAGVYYWAIIPKTKDGIKIFPNVSGIIVAVEKDELWYDKATKNIYKWNADSWTECPANFSPGAAGVHQWVLMQAD